MQKSPWTHVFMVTGQNELVEADTFVGVRTYPMVSRMQELVSSGRSYIVLEPTMDLATRRKMASNARELVGRGYNYYSALQWTLTGNLHHIPGDRLTCGELIARSLLGCGRPLFTPVSVYGLPEKQQVRLLNNWATPTDILLYSTLTVCSQHLSRGKTYPLR